MGTQTIQEILVAGIIGTTKATTKQMANGVWRLYINGQEVSKHSNVLIEHSCLGCGRTQYPITASSFLKKLQNPKPRCETCELLSPCHPKSLEPIPNLCGIRNGTIGREALDKMEYVEIDGRPYFCDTERGIVLSPDQPVFVCGVCHQEYRAKSIKKAVCPHSHNEKANTLALSRVLKWCKDNGVHVSATSGDDVSCYLPDIGLTLSFYTNKQKRPPGTYNHISICPKNKQSVLKHILRQYKT